MGGRCAKRDTSRDMPGVFSQDWKHAQDGELSQDGKLAQDGELSQDDEIDTQFDPLTPVPSWGTSMMRARWLGSTTSLTGFDSD